MPRSISNGDTGDCRAPGLLQFSRAHCKYTDNLLSRKCKREAPVSCGSQEAGAGKLPPLSDSIDLLNSLPPASLSLPLCPSYLDRREQREENVLSLQPPLWDQPCHAHILLGLLELQSKQRGASPLWSYDRGWFNLQGSGMCLKRWEVTLAVVSSAPGASAAWLAG